MTAPQAAFGAGGTIHGVGVDLLEVSRMARMLDRLGERALRRLFDPGEVRDAGPAGGPNRVRRLAARLAAKEAAYKALGLGGPLRWRDIVVVKGPRGVPEVRLVGGTARLAAAAGIGRIHLSLSHERHLVAAMALAERA
jgi:holo-[acyl-carrier protein] synthase